MVGYEGSGYARGRQRSPGTWMLCLSAVGSPRCNASPTVGPSHLFAIPWWVLICIHPSVHGRIPFLAIETRRTLGHQLLISGKIKNIMQIEHLIFFLCVARWDIVSTIVAVLGSNHLEE